MNIKSINHPNNDREYFSFVVIIKINSGKNINYKIQNKISFVVIITFNFFRNRGLIFFISNREVKIQTKKMERKFQSLKGTFNVY